MSINHKFPTNEHLVLGNGIICFQQNVDTLRTKTADVFNFVLTLSFSIIAVTETWLDAGISVYIGLTSDFPVMFLLHRVRLMDLPWVHYYL